MVQDHKECCVSIDRTPVFDFDVLVYVKHVTKQTKLSDQIYKTASIDTALRPLPTTSIANLLLSGESLLSTCRAFISS